MHPVVFALAPLLWGVAAAVAQPNFTQITGQPQNPERFQKFELTIGLAADFDNPFDPEQIELQAHFTAPGGAVHTVAGFYYQDFSDGGAPNWKIRFAPNQVGTWSYAISFRTGTDVAIAASPAAGKALAPFDGITGTFAIAATDKTGRAINTATLARQNSLEKNIGGLDREAGTLGVGSPKRSATR